MEGEYEEFFKEVKKLQDEMNNLALEICSARPLWLPGNSKVAM